MTTGVSPSPVAVAVCQRCGCQSTLPKLFLKVWNGLLCPACAAKRELHKLQLLYGSALLLLGVLLLGSWLLTGLFWPLGLDLLQLFYLSFILLLLHELSHAAAGWLLGGRVFGLHLGMGRLLLQRWLGSFYVGLSLLPASGVCFVGFPPGKGLRRRFGLMVLAGPLFHLLLLLLLLPSTRAQLGLPGVGWVLITFFLNGFMLLLNLWPWLKAPTAMGVIQSDGGQLWQLLRGKITTAQLEQNYYQLAATFALQQKRHEQALAEIATGLARYPEQPILRQLHGYMLLHNRQLAESLSIWQALIDAPPAPGMTPELHGLLLALHYNNYAWTHLLLQRDPTDLTIAADYAQRAFAMTPWLAPIRGTLAAVQIARGDLAAGIPLALDAAALHQQDRSPIAQEGRAINLAIAAFGYHRQGNAAEAQRLLTEAQRLAPQDLIVRRMTAEMAAGQGSDRGSVWERTHT